MKILFLGDSITEGVGVDDIENCRYDNVLRREYGLAATYNYGIGGTRIAHQSVPSEKPRHDLCFCGRVYNIDPNADIIVVYGGANDYIHGDAYIGTPEDKTPATFCGGVNFLMDYLMENVEGEIPRYDELTEAAKATVDVVGVASASKEKKQHIDNKVLQK